MKIINQKRKIIIRVLLILATLIIITYFLGTKKEQQNDIIENVAIITNEIPEKTEEQEIVIHISGCVVEKGIVKLKENNCRIMDAIEAAGGVTEEADLEEINLAYQLTDGQKIIIPSKNNKKEENKEYVIETSGNNITKEENKKTGGNKVININTATQMELESLPGIGPSTAQKIIEYRNTNGKYKNIEDIKNIQGIADAKFNKIKDSIKVK